MRTKTKAIYILCFSIYYFIIGLRTCVTGLNYAQHNQTKIHENLIHFDIINIIIMWLNGFVAFYLMLWIYGFETFTLITNYRLPLHWKTTRKKLVNFIWAPSQNTPRHCHHFCHNLKRTSSLLTLFQRKQFDLIVLSLSLIYGLIGANIVKPNTIYCACTVSLLGLFLFISWTTKSFGRRFSILKIEIAVERNTFLQVKSKPIIRFGCRWIIPSSSSFRFFFVNYFLVHFQLFHGTLNRLGVRRRKHWNRKCTKQF